MVKPPKIRHSKSRREPMTIELGPDEISRIEEAKGEAAPQEPAEDGQTAHAAATADDTGSAGEASPTTADIAPAEAAEQAAPIQNEPPAEPIAADADKSERLGEDENAAFIGSEWPPEPAAASEPERATEAQAGAADTDASERVRHAFGRDPGTPLPGRSAQRDDGEAPIAAPPERRGAGISAIAAGIIGGVITLVGAGALQFAGVLPSPGSSTAPVPGNEQDIAALKGELAALREQVDAVKAGSGGDTSALSQSVGDLSAAVKTVSGALDQVKADVATLRDSVAKGGAGDGAAVQALNQKIAELAASVAALGQAGPGVGKDQLDSINQQVDAINQKLGAVEQAAAAATDAAKAGDGRLGTLEQNFAGLGEKLSGFEQKLTGLEQNVATLTDQLSKQEAQPKVALAIAAAALKSAIERGGPFTAEVDTFAAISPNAPELPRLREIAQTGVANRAELTAGMDDAASAMIEASEALPADAGFWDSLVASMESLVKVRPIGDVEGDTVPAKVARMEVAVKAGELTKALAEFDSLPDAAKAAGQAFADKIRLRAEAEELVAKALAGAMKQA
jgi:hypothetical protein